MASRIRFRRDTKNNWLIANPILDDGEFVIETDTHQYKIGNGSQSYSALPYRGLPVESVTGSSTTTAMSQKAVTDLHNTLKSGSISSSSITQDFGNDATKVISQKGYTDDMKAWLPSSVYSDRVAADSGSIKDKIGLFDSYKTALNLLPNTLLAYSPEMGVKQSISGLVYKATKLYDMSQNNNDANQATAGLQPYIGGNIAPNEKLWLWGDSKFISINPIAFSTTDKWSFSVVGEQLFGLSLTGGGGSIVLYGNAMHFVNSLGANVTIPYTSGSVISRTTRYMFVCRGNGEIEAWINGKLEGKGVIANTSITVGSIYLTKLKLKALRIFNKDLSKSEIEGLDKFLASIYPEHETTNIGSQAWVTSNHIGNVTSDGFVIPEVQSNDAASNPELITNAADRDFSSDTGFWAKTAQVTIGGGVCNIKSADGSLQTLSRSNIFTSGKTHKITYDIVANRGGTLRIHSGTSSVVIDSTVGVGKVAYILAAGNDFSIVRNGVTDIDIDKLSIKEAGWSDSQAIYDYYISVGKSVLEASRAAAMCCKYNNSDDNAAVYGYLYNWWAAYLFWLYPPKGLRVPTKADFDQLVATLGGATVAGGKLKKEGLSYWNSPNSGATNETGFSAVGSGFRNADGSFSGSRTLSPIWTATSADATYAHRLYIQASQGSAVSDTTDKRLGFALRFLKNAPVGNETQELDTGIFTTDIATAQKELTMSFGHKVTEIKVNSLTNNLTNFKVELRSSAGVLLTTLVQNVSITANSPIDIPILVTQPMLFQDAKLWINATGNTGANNLGMQIQVLTKQNIY